MIPIWSDTFKAVITSALTAEQQTDRIVQRLLFICTRGKDATREYLRSESDKWMHLPQLIPVFEREVFDVGESGIEARSPWNGERVLKAQLERIIPKIK